jgi:hypothetical protein
VSIVILALILAAAVLTGVGCMGGKFTAVNYRGSGDGNERIYTFDSLKGEMVETATTVTDATILRIAVVLARGIMEVSVLDAGNNILVHGAASPSYSGEVRGAFPAGTYRIVYKVHDTAHNGRVEITFETPADD